MTFSIKKEKTIVLSVMLVLGTLVMAAPQSPNAPASLPGWPNDADWINYTVGGDPVRDWEDKPYENDPTHGIANVQPAAVDIASGVDASGGGPDNNPGDYTSVQYLYLDEDSDSTSCDNLEDDYLFLRMRVAADPTHGGKFAYKAYHWDILVDTDGDVWSEFVVDLNGGGGFYKFGTVGVYYSDDDDYEYDPDTDHRWLAEASANSNEYTRAVFIDYDNANASDDQYWIEYRIPVTAFTNENGVQQLCSDTNFRLFFSTSASATNPLQKDWMGEYIFGEPANITVIKIVEETTATPGDTLHYKIFYNNTGDFNASNVWVNDTIPDNTTFLESSPDYDSVSGQTYRWHFTDVAPGNHTIYLNVTVDLYVQDGTVLENVVVLNYTDNNGGEVPGSNGTTETTVETPIMTIMKSADPTAANPGDDIHYIIYYENTGSGDAYDVYINDTIPDHTTYVNSTPDCDWWTGDTCTWYFSTIPGNSSGYIHLFVELDAYIPDETELGNYVILEYYDENGNPYDPQDDWANVTVTAPMMELSKTSAQTTADPGEEITYTIYYENTGTGGATDVVIVDTIDPDTIFVSATPSPASAVGGVVTWNIGNVPAGGSGSISVVVRVKAGVGDGDILVNHVTLNYDDANGNPQDELSDYWNVTCTAPVLTVTKIADKDEANPGDYIMYTITYANTGSGDAGNVVITDTIDSHTEYVNATPAPSSNLGGVIKWELGTVEAGGSGTIFLNVSVDTYLPDGLVLTNTAVLSYEDPNGNEYEDESDDVDVTVTAPDMEITKVANRSEANPDDYITYTITYKNKGNGTATDVVIVDTVDPNTTYVTAVPAPFPISGNVLTWSIGDVAGGASVDITLVVRVNSYVDDGTVLTNSVTLNYDDANGNPYGEESDEVEVTVTAPMMTILKVADTGLANPGDTIMYTIYYWNNGTGTATGVVITDEIDPHTTYDDADPEPDHIIGDLLIWNLTVVEGGGSGSITLWVKVNAYVTDGTVMTNTVFLNYNDTNDNPYPEESDHVDVKCTAPELTITKTANKPSANPGDTITYTIYYKNKGNGTATGVVIVDTIDPETSYANATPAPTSVVGDVITWYIGDLDGGESGTIKLNVTVDAYTDDGEVLTNMVTLNYDDTNGNPYDEVYDFVNVTCTAPSMEVTKTADMETANPGDLITYTITYENLGSGDATSVVIVDTIDPDTTYKSATPGPSSVVGDVITWNIGTVAGGAEISIELVVEVDAYVGDGEILRNDVTLNYADANGNPYPEESDYFDVVCTAPDISVTKTADKSEANPGDTIVYTIFYENKGSGNATNVVVEDTIPADTTFVSATPPGYVKVDDTLTWTFALVEGESSGTITITVTVDAGIGDGTVLRNDVTLNYDDANGNPQDEEDDYAETTVTAPVMHFSKTASTSKADPGDTITYTLTCENSGDGNATLVVIQDTIPAGVTFIGSEPDYNTSAGRTYTWIIGLVEAHTTETITITVQVNVSVPDGTLLRNNATMEYADANGNYYDPMEDHADTTVTAPVMSFTKSADVAKADPGDFIVYTLYYENAGSGNATLVVIEDTIPSGVTLTGSTPAHSSSSGNTYTWIIGFVGAYSNGTITITVKVNVGVADGTLLRNNATMDYADENGNYYDPLDDHADTTVTAPVMSFSKTASVATADPGDTVIFTLHYENSGSGDATLVVIEDTIPSGMTFVSATPVNTSSSGNVYTWNIGPVPAFSSGTITITVTVDAGVGDGTVLNNSATEDYADANGNYYDQLEDYAAVTVTAPVLNITKVADVEDADPGDFITYTIVFENTGSGNATNVWINDTIPGSTTIDSTTPGHNYSTGDTYTWFFVLVEGGESVTITVIVKVDLKTPDKEVLHNSVTLDYSDANGNPLDRESAFADVNATAPVLHITKTADNSTADPGDTVLFTIHYWNSGTGVATLVEIVDTIPAYLTVTGTVPGWTGKAGNTYTWYIGDVGPDGYGFINITVKVNVGAPDGELQHNVATLDYADANGNYYDQLSAYFDVTVTAPILHITKKADVSTAYPGDTIVYEIKYWNSGTGWATLVKIVDTIPADTDFIGSAPGYNSSSGDEYTWLIGSLQPGGTGTILVTVKVKAGTPDTRLLHNVAELSYADANGNYYTPQSVHADVTVKAPDMRITKVASLDLADPGTTIMYTITYTNLGTGYAYNVVITDTIPDDATFLDSNPGSTSSSGKTYTWELGTVLPGTTHYIFINVTVDVGTADETLLHNLAKLDYEDPNENAYPQQKDHADTHVTAPVLVFNKTADNPEADPGDLIVYMIEYKNTGTGKATLVEIVDTLPAYATFVDATPGYVCVDKVCTWFIGDLDPGKNGTITITVRVDARTGDGELLRNEATLDYADANGNYYEQMDDYADVRVTAPVLHLKKSVHPPTADPGDSVIFTIEYWNSGSGWASGVVIVDTIPLETSFVMSVPFTPISSGNTYTWIIGDLEPDGSGSIMIVVTTQVGLADKTPIHNEATLDYADPNGNYYDQLSDYADAVITAPVVTVTKTAEVAEADPGDVFSYTIYYNNEGTGNASNVVIIDTLPDNVTYEGASPAPSHIIGNVLIWNIVLVEGLSDGSITVTVKVKPGVKDRTVLHNEVTLDYSDANGNFIEQVDDYADVTVTAPVIELEKTSGDVTVDAYIVADFRLRIAGEKWHDVQLTLYDGDVEVAFASITRFPGDPDDQSVTIYDVRINLLSGTFWARVVYTPEDDAINGQWLGANPCWLILTFEDGSEARLKHTFNVRHEETWIWEVTDFTKVLKNAPIVYEATIPYTITYANIGSGDASDVIITDILPANSVIVDLTPATVCIGNVCTWYIGDLASGVTDYVFITITYIFMSDDTMVKNEVTLDYADANGNYIGQAYAYVFVLLEKPELGYDFGGILSDGEKISMTTGTLPVYTAAQMNGLVQADEAPTASEMLEETPSADVFTTSTMPMNDQTEELEVLESVPEACASTVQEAQMEVPETADESAVQVDEEASARKSMTLEPDVGPVGRDAMELPTRFSGGIAGVATSSAFVYLLIALLGFLGAALVIWTRLRARKKN